MRETDNTAAGPRRAIVFGASSGIGRELALELARRGWDVAVCARREALLERLAEANPHIRWQRVIDACDPEAPAQLERLFTEMGGADLYLHSAGTGWHNIGLDPVKEAATVELNALGWTRLVDTAFRCLSRQSRGGRLAAITSVAATRPLGAAPAYSATKRYQAHYLEALSQMARMRRLRVRVTDVRPGFVSTDLLAHRHYPMQLSARRAALLILEAVERGRAVAVIDWRYRILTSLWRLIPRWVWVRMRVK